MKYKLLAREEWGKVASIWAEYGSVPPAADPHALISVAMDGDRIVGGMGFQMLPHLEGIWVDSSFSGKVGFRMLRNRLLDALPKGLEYFAFVPSWPIARICDYWHMEKKPWAVYRGVV